MGLRFHKKIRLWRNLYLNISRTGISLSFGKPGASVNVSTKGITSSIGIPGSGISYRKGLFNFKRKSR